MSLSMFGMRLSYDLAFLLFILAFWWLCRAKVRIYHMVLIRLTVLGTMCMLQQLWGSR